MSSSQSFNPTDPRYRALCCHVKTFMIVYGILEMFTICFMLVAVLPDMNARTCAVWRGEMNESALDEVNTYNVYTGGGETLSLVNSTAEQRELAQAGYPSDVSIQRPVEVENYTYDPEFLEKRLALRLLACDFSLGWLVCALAHVLATTLMLYGIKNTRWPTFIPHFLFRIVLTCFVAAVIAWFIYSLGYADPKHISASIVAVVALALLALFFVYSLWCEFRCMHFVKCSHDTGFSISVARPIGPATISLVEQGGAALENVANGGSARPPRTLPPIRNYNTRGANYQTDKESENK